MGLVDLVLNAMPVSGIRCDRTQFRLPETVTKETMLRRIRKWSIAHELAVGCGPGSYMQAEGALQGTTSLTVPCSRHS